MEHPLIGSLEDFTPEQLLEKITELSRKLSIAHSMGNGHLCNQLRMAIESHQNKYQEKIRRTTDTNFDGVIDIS
jgi:esterase/lipase superfamily enzyme